jgi:hypothetical protein
MHRATVSGCYGQVERDIFSGANQVTNGFSIQQAFWNNPAAVGRAQTFNRDSCSNLDPQIPFCPFFEFCVKPF